MGLNDVDVRPQSPAQSRWDYSLDPAVGLKQHVDNNQPLMALEYARRLLVAMESRVKLLELQVEKLAQEKAPVVKTVSRTKTEEVKVEE